MWPAMAKGAAGTTRGGTAGRAAELKRVRTKGACARRPGGSGEDLAPPSSLGSAPRRAPAQTPQDVPLQDSGAEYQVRVQRQLRATLRVPQTSPTTQTNRQFSNPPPLHASTPAPTRASCLAAWPASGAPSREWTLHPPRFLGHSPEAQPQKVARPCPGAFLELSF